VCGCRSDLHGLHLDRLREDSAAVVLVLRPPTFALPMRRGLSTSHSGWRKVTVMTAPDDARTRWPDGGSPGYQHLPEPVALEETIALHPAGPAEPPHDWSTGFVDSGDGGDGDG
jgi:hypothetical protein